MKNTAFSFHQKIIHATSVKSKVWITTDLFFAAPTSRRTALKTAHFIAPLYFFKWDLTTCTPRISHFINLELVKIYVFILSLLTAPSGMSYLLALSTDFCRTSKTNCLVLTTAAWLLDNSVAINGWTPKLALVKGNWLVQIQLLETLKNFSWTQSLNVSLIIFSLLRAIQHHTGWKSWFSLRNACL